MDNDISFREIDWDLLDESLYDEDESWSDDEDDSDEDEDDGDGEEW